jgi:pyrroline-5-carboxylate reductase
MRDYPSGSVLLVGAGRMGGALLKGWLAGGFPAERIFVQEPSPPPDVAEAMAGAGVRVGEPPGMDTAPQVMLLAIKPQAMDAVLPGVAPLAGPQTVVLSIAAGTSIASIARHFAADTAIIRAMPNTPAAIGRGITALCASAHASAPQRAACEALLKAGGETVWVDAESLIDAVTAVSGSGPAYVFLLAECLAEAGRAAGLNAELAAKLAGATVSGAGELLHRSPQSPAELRRNVTSPGGTTQAALDVLMGSGEAGMPHPLQELMTQAVAAALRRAGELAG